ncbi:MBL fold metallo-hydrolase [Candidatus Shapirobacteria bacterium]|nr:MBL fold metallo-hydrolase [Candidatus Shapirobacteria bacterium]
MKIRLIYFFGFLVLLAAVILLAIFSFPDQKLHLIFCDVGQGDAILVVRGSTQALIDGGPDNKVLGCLAKHLPFWDKKLELVILTHPEPDHLTGLVSVAESYQIKQLVANSLVLESGAFEEFRQTIIKKKTPVFTPKAGDKIRISGLAFNVLFPKEKLGNEIVWHKPEGYRVLGLSSYTGNFNQTALVTELSFGKFQALLTGDIGAEEEAQIAPVPVEVLKVGHHGSKYSSSKEFLEKIKPALAVISVGAANRYGHPTPEVLGRLKELGIKVLRTDLDGEVEIISDGRSWEVR